MDRPTLERRLLEAILPHDLLSHPFYRAWSAGALTRSDLALYAAQYQHQVDALPHLLRRCAAGAADFETRASLARNLAEEEGADGIPHAELWQRFGAALGVRPASPEPETVESVGALRALTAAGDVGSLAALWEYELQTARVASVKREGLERWYGMADPRATAFFSLHATLDVHHAADLLAAVHRACGDSGDAVQQASEAAARAAQAQCRFLDGAERLRHSAPVNA